MTDGAMCHYCRKYECVCDDLRQPNPNRYVESVTTGGTPRRELTPEMEKHIRLCYSEVPDARLLFAEIDRLRAELATKRTVDPVGYQSEMQYVESLQQKQRIAELEVTVKRQTTQYCDRLQEETGRAYAAEAELTKAREELAQALAWKHAVTDAMVVDWVLAKDNENDPRKAINDLLAQAQQYALDPAISEQPAKWVAEITTLRAQLATAREALEKIANGDILKYPYTTSTHSIETAKEALAAITKGTTSER